MNIDLYKVLPIVISSFAFFISYLSYRKVKKIDDNSMIRLIVASETLEADFQSVVFKHGLVHCLPGIINEDYVDELNASYNRVEFKIELIFDLILKNKEISHEDIRKIVNKLEVIETDVGELKHLKIQSNDELDIAQSIMNPMIKNIEVVKSTLSEYDNKN